VGYTCQTIRNISVKKGMKNKYRYQIREEKKLVLYREIFLSNVIQGIFSDFILYNKKV